MNVKKKISNSIIQNKKKIINTKEIKIDTTPYITNNNLFNIDIKLNKSIKKNKVIFTLTSTPLRFINDNFEKNIISLINQEIEPDYIVINLCKKYKRNFIYDNNLFLKKIEYYRTTYNKIHINICENDYGPITKVLGLYDFTIKFDPEDLIISLDDDSILDKNTIFIYLLIDLIYSPDFIATPQYIYYGKPILQEIIKPSYNNSIYGWMTFGIKYKLLNELYNYYHKYITITNDLWKHDDLILTMFYKENNLSCCEFTMLLIKGNIEIDAIDSLRNDDINNNFYRNKLQNLYSNILNKYTSPILIPKIEEDEINEYMNNIVIKYVNNNIKILKKDI